MNTRTTGSLAERVAALFLEMSGYSILATGYRFHGREVDVVAQRDSTVVFVEVKFRSGRGKGAPREAVGWKKRRHIVYTAKGFLCEKGLREARCRFDVIEVELLRGGQSMRLEHLVGAFCADS